MEKTTGPGLGVARAAGKGTTLFSNSHDLGPLGLRRPSTLKYDKSKQGSPAATKVPSALRPRACFTKSAAHPALRAFNSVLD